MEPLHITEFASERYFSKLRQIDENAENGSGSGLGNANGTTSTGSSGVVSTNHEPSPLDAATFNLPSRQKHVNHENLALRPNDQKKRSLGHDLSSLRTQRRPSFSSSFGSLRSKVNRTPSIVETHEEILIEERIEPQSVSISLLFLRLPNELQAQIIAPLPIHTILDLRQVSKAFHAIVTLNEAPIARYHATHTLPAYTIRLYPLPDPARLNLHYLAGIWHRLHVASKLSQMISLQAQKEIFLRTTDAQVKEFKPQYEKMRQRLIPLVFTIFHFFENYRNLYAQHLARNGPPLTRIPYTLNPFEAEVMKMYDDRTLLHVHQVFPLVMSSFSRRLRPPSYVGRVERSIRGYLKDRPPDEVYTAILMVGGLRQAERFWETKGYNVRRAAVDQWYGFLQSSKPPTIEPTITAPKSKMSKFTHLGRRKTTQSPVHSQSDKDSIYSNYSTRSAYSTHSTYLTHSTHSTHSTHDSAGWFCVKPNCIATTNPTSDNSNSMVWRTSLSAGPPMRPLGKEEMGLLMENLPDLYDIWVKTAEATILKRGIVDRPERIKKNSLVLLDLIKQDGREEMDGWEGGRAGAGSVVGADGTDAGSVSD